MAADEQPPPDPVVQDVNAQSASSIIGILSAASYLIQLAMQWKANSARAKEMSPEEEAAYDKKLEEAKSGAGPWRIRPDPS